MASPTPPSTIDDLRAEEESLEHFLVHHEEALLYFPEGSEAYERVQISVLLLRVSLIDIRRRIVLLLATQQVINMGFSPSLQLSILSLPFQFSWKFLHYDRFLRQYIYPFTVST